MRLDGRALLRRPPFQDRNHLIGDAVLFGTIGSEVVVAEIGPV